MKRTPWGKEQDPRGVCVRPGTSIPSPGFGMAGLALGAACPCTVSCAGFNCMKVSDPKNHPMLTGLHPYECKPCPCGRAFSQEHKQKEADAHSQLMPKFHFQTGLWGAPPAGFLGMHRNGSTVP